MTQAHERSGQPPSTQQSLFSEAMSLGDHSKALTHAYYMYLGSLNSHIVMADSARFSNGPLMTVHGDQTDSASLSHLQKTELKGISSSNEYLRAHPFMPDSRVIHPFVEVAQGFASVGDTENAMEALSIIEGIVDSAVTSWDSANPKNRTGGIGQYLLIGDGRLRVGDLQGAERIALKIEERESHFPPEMSRRSSAEDLRLGLAQAFQDAGDFESAARVSGVKV